MSSGSSVEAEFDGGEEEGSEIQALSFGVGDELGCERNVEVRGEPEGEPFKAIM